MQDVQLTIAQPQDLPYIVQVYNSTIPSGLATADLEPVTVASRQHWFDAHNAASRPLWIVKYKGETAGWMGFNNFYGRPAYHSTAEISIYLDERFRGKGIGKTCLQKACERAPQLGIRTVLAFVFGHNVHSIRLFMNEGFQQWGQLPEVADMHGTQRDLVILGRKMD
jgi:L-amino acid N-acyltransferase YncA